MVDYIGKVTELNALNHIETDWYKEMISREDDVVQVITGKSDNLGESCHKHNKCPTFLIWSGMYRDRLRYCKTSSVISECHLILSATSSSKWLYLSIFIPCIQQPLLCPLSLFFSLFWYPLPIAPADMQYSCRRRCLTVFIVNVPENRTYLIFLCLWQRWQTDYDEKAGAESWTLKWWYISFYLYEGGILLFDGIPLAWTFGHPGYKFLP